MNGSSPIDEASAACDGHQEEWFSAPCAWYLKKGPMKIAHAPSRLRPFAWRAAVLFAWAAVSLVPACKRDEAQPFRPAASLPPPALTPAPVPTPIPTPTPKPAPSPGTWASGLPNVAPAPPVATIAASGGGCGQPVSVPPRGVTHTTTSGRTFHVWAPQGYDGKQKLPVVLVFHGWYASGQAFQSWFKMEDYVENRAIVVYPDSQGPTWALSGDKDTSFVAKMISDLDSAYCIDKSRTFAFGFSYGGKFTHTLGCTHPELVKAISVGDGSLGGSLTKCGALPVLVTHRTRDDDERFEWGKTAAETWAGVNGCSKDTAPSPMEHGCVAYKGCKPNASVTFCEDPYFNATWPHDWNHTVREEYRALTWRWFASLP